MVLLIYFTVLGKEVSVQEDKYFIRTSRNLRRFSFAVIFTRQDTNLTRQFTISISIAQIDHLRNRLNFDLDKNFITA
jgi:hypothetical protein